MLIVFEPLDFMSQDRWQSLLDKLNVPPGVMPSVKTVTVETNQVDIGYMDDHKLLVAKYNPDEAHPGC